MRNEDEMEGALEAEETEVANSQGHSAVGTLTEAESNVARFGQPLEVIEWDLPPEAKPPHRPKQCFKSRPFKVTTNNGFRFLYCPIGQESQKLESSEFSALYFSGDDGLTLTYRLTCDGDLKKTHFLTKLLDKDIGYGFPKFTDPSACSKVGVEVYHITSYRWSWYVGNLRESTMSEPFKLAEVPGWRLKIQPSIPNSGGPNMCGLFLFAPSDTTVTVDFYLMSGGAQQAVKRSGNRFSVTFSSGSGLGHGFPQFVKEPCYNVGVEILKISAGGISHTIADPEDRTSVDESVLESAIASSEKAEEFLKQQAQALASAREGLLDTVRPDSGPVESTTEQA